MNISLQIPMIAAKHLLMNIIKIICSVVFVQLYLPTICRLFWIFQYDIRARL